MKFFCLRIVKRLFIRVICWTRMDPGHLLRYAFLKTDQILYGIHENAVLKTKLPGLYLVF